MPKLIPIEKVKEKLPSFVEIVASSYRGMRYKCKFIDKEYNQEFEAIPRAVIELQHGCPQRANQRRGLGCKGKGRYYKTPIEEIKAKLPPYITIDESTYKGIRSQAKFLDTEYNYPFTALVCNVIRNGTSYYCPKRKLKEFRKKITIKAEEINQRLELIYNGEFKIIPETYKNTNTTATFIRKDGSTFIAGVCNALSGKLGEARYRLQDWVGFVKVSSNYKCFICGSEKNLCVHHIFSWEDYPSLRFHKENGLCLCEDCHNDFHSRQKHSTLNLVNGWLESKGIGPLLKPNLELSCKN